MTAEKKVEASAVVEARPGEHVRSAAERMVRKLRTHTPVVCDFNDVRLTAVLGMSVDDILTSYQVQCDERVRAYEASPEGKAQKAEDERQRSALQAQADALMASLPYLDFSDVGKVLDWFCAIEEPRDRIGVTVPLEPIVKMLAENGYYAGVNCGPDFDETSRDNFARWIIGQALSDPCPPLVRHFAEQWRKRFGAREGQ